MAYPTIIDQSIALAPTLSKVLEWCILIQFCIAFVTSSLQFGFKPGASTDLCTGLIKCGTAKYTVTMTLQCTAVSWMDASKAFDRVDHALLFKKLLQRNLPPTVVRTLISWYSDQRFNVLWDKTVSVDFSISNGVRQDGVLSPIFFTICIDELLYQLEQLGVGCYWKHHFDGAVCYADDITLLAPSQSALSYRLLLNMYTPFADSHSLQFNANKTQLIKFSCCRID
jgi:retron-type reverse transcriptase